MTLILDDGILFIDFSLSVLIGKILSANITSIVCNVAVCRLGRVLCLDKGHRVTLGCNNGVLFIDLRCALFIRIILSANGAGIVRRITFVGTRRVFCLDSAHGMPFRFHNGRIERNLLCPCLVRIVLSATITLVIYCEQKYLNCMRFSSASPRKLRRRERPPSCRAMRCAASSHELL